MNPNPYAPPSAVVADVMLVESESPATPFFPVSAFKLLVLSLCTLGLYQVYWFYKNWQLIRLREQSSIYPAIRALFAVFFCYACFKRIGDFDESAGVGRLAAGPLAAGWIIVSLLHKLPDPYWFVSLFAVVFLVPVQDHVNRINAAVSPDHDPNAQFGFWNWVAIVIGSIVLVLAIIGSTMPEA